VRIRTFSQDIRLAMEMRDGGDKPLLEPVIEEGEDHACGRRPSSR
jgi:hypothetical protein